MRTLALGACSLWLCACFTGTVDVPQAPAQDASEDLTAPKEDAGPGTPPVAPPRQDMSEPAQDMEPVPQDMSPPPEDMPMPPQDMEPPTQVNPCDAGPLDGPIPNCRPAPMATTGDPAEDCVRRINQLRWECQCLPPLERWTQGESCAAEQSAYDASGKGAHAGFRDRICSPGGRGQNECPGYGTWDRVIGRCLQQMWDEGPGEPFIEHGHYINMTNPQHTKVACGGADGWFIQNFQ